MSGPTFGIIISSFHPLLLHAQRRHHPREQLTALCFCFWCCNCCLHSRHRWWHHVNSSPSPSCCRDCLSSLGGSGNGHGNQQQARCVSTKAWRPLVTLTMFFKICGAIPMLTAFSPPPLSLVLPGSKISHPYHNMVAFMVLAKPR